MSMSATSRQKQKEDKIIKQLGLFDPMKESSQVPQSMTKRASPDFKNIYEAEPQQLSPEALSHATQCQEE